MQFNISFDQAIGSLPTGFVAAINYVVDYFDHLFTDNITINIDVGFGEVNGQSLSSGALGESITNLNSYSYSAIKSALTGDATSPADATAIASLPSSDPINGTHTYWVSTAEQKALGLLASNATGIDGYVGFSSTSPFDYNRNDGIASGFYDFIGVVEHEFSEVMGRVVLVGETIGNTPNGFEPLDLFDYSSPAVRRLVGTTPGYFSINGGTTNLDNFNTDPGGDFGDWAASAGNDSALAFSSSGVMNVFSPTDVLAMDVIGYNRAPATSHDFSGDGISDILWRSSANGQTVESVMNGGTVISSGFVGGDSTWSVIGTGDFNGDGKTDILWRSSANGQTFESDMNGGTVISSGFIGGDSTWSVIGTGDFNGDGKTDILWRSSANGQTVVNFMNDRTVTGSSVLGGDLTWSVIGTGDFNGDGKTDILWRSSANGQTFESDMNGGTVISSGFIGGDSTWSVIGTGDFNGDGKTDILWRSSANGQTVVNFMNDRTVTGSSFLGGDLTWSVIGTGDFNGDGMSDILWRSNANGQTFESEMNGGTVISSNFVGGDLTWKPVVV